MIDRYARWAGVILVCGALAACSGGEPEEKKEAPPPAEKAPPEPKPAPRPEAEPSGEPVAEPEAAPGEEPPAEATPEEAAPEPTPAEEPAPAASAEGLTLVGVIGGDNPAALIESDGTQEMFRKGESVFGAATVKEVGGGAVVLDADGQEIRLALPAVEAPEASAPPPPTVEMAPPTPVPGGELNLVGIVGGRSPAALIEYGGVEEMFRAGEEVFDKGRVRVVNESSVVIAGEGGDITLNLPVAEPEAEPTPEPAVVAEEPEERGAPTPPPVTRPISRSEAQQGFADFGDVLSAAGAEAVPPGKTPGIRLGELPNDSFLRMLGLKSGDVLQKIEGIALSDPDDLPDLSGAAQGRSVSVTCLRGDVGLTFSRPIQ